jgi:uncharacterized membrane protein
MWSRAAEAELCEDPARPLRNKPAGTEIQRTARPAAQIIIYLKSLKNHSPGDGRFCISLLRDMRKRKPILNKDKEFEYIDGVAVPKAKMVNRASPVRTIAKTISWRIIASLTTFIIFYFTTDHKVAAAVLGISVVIESVTKMVIYYFHERLWETVDWGKMWLRYGLIRRIKLNYIKRKRKKRVFLKRNST